MAIVFDVETYCDLDLEEVGVMNYTKHPSFKIILLSWLDTDNSDAVHTWEIGQNIHKDFYQDTMYYAHNAQFEFECLRKDKNWPSIASSQFIDTQALCARYGFPQKLEAATRLLCPDEAKMEEGKDLIKKFCCPPAAPYKGPNWDKFITYNRQDVRATYALLHALPCNKLSPEEQKIFQLNWTINRRGLPMDIESARLIYKVTNEYLSHVGETLEDITDGKVTTPKQVKRIREWLVSKGYDVPNLQAGTVAELLDEDLPQDVRDVLELRAAASLSSIGKYKRIINMTYDGRMYYNSRYHGAHTGRITGMGFQMLNLPRAKTSDPEAAIQEFKDLTVENPVVKARALVRPMIKAPERYKFLCADYSSIEYVMLMWLAKEKKALELFDQGLDQYKLLAMHMYHKGYEDITKEERQMGKIGILGCGYGMGAKRCKEYAKDFGVDLSYTDADFVVNSFREKYPLVRRLWAGLSNAAISAVSRPGQIWEYNGCAFQVVRHRGNKMLKLTLPSQRNMYYHNPKVVQGMYGPVVQTYGVNQTTHQWAPKEITPGKWAENIIQAISRDILYNGKFYIEEAGYHIIGSIYDEVLCEVPDTDEYKLETLCNLMCIRPKWCLNAPLKADGWEGYRYKKD